MEKAKHSIEFHATVDAEGKIQLSRSVARELQLKSGEQVTVKVIGGVMSKELAARDVSEDEIEGIGKLQLEDREHVVKFLTAQGGLSHDASFRKRAKGLFR